MRIISGKLKRHTFIPPKGFPSRPTTDFAKEGLFNILENQLYLSDLEILDLFAGTGNISFEFASREAGRITSVDQNLKCIQFIKIFVKKYELEETVIPVKIEVMKFIEKYAKPYDLIFADPPFDKDLHSDLIDKVMSGSLLKKDGLFILEHGTRKSFADKEGFQNSRKFGNVVFSFFKHNS